MFNFTWNNAFQRLLNVIFLMTLIAVCLFLGSWSNLTWLRVTALAFQVFLLMEACERYDDYCRQKHRALPPVVEEDDEFVADLTERLYADPTEPISVKYVPPSRR